MDRKGKPVAMAKLAEKFLRGIGQQHRLRELGIFDVWDQLVGGEIAKNAQPVSISDGRLIVAVSSSVWLNELGFARPKIKARLNRELGKGTIKDITFRIGEIKNESPRQTPGQKPPSIDPELSRKIDQALASIDDAAFRDTLKAWLTALASR